MKANRHEEILEECLSALLEGRRSIRESLSLYPALAEQLEPLLRIAAEITEGYKRQSPPAGLLDESRQRFLAAASTRNRARSPSRELGSPKPAVAGLWRIRRWWLLGGAAAVVIGVAVLAGASQFSRDAGNSSAPVITLRTLTTSHDQLREAATRGGNVSPETIRELTETTTRLALQIEDPSSVNGLEAAIQEQFVLLSSIEQEAPQPEVQEALGLTEQLASLWGFDLPGLTPDAGTTTAPSTPAPTRSPAETATAPATPVPSEEAPSPAD